MREFWEQFVYIFAKFVDMAACIFESLNALVAFVFICFMCDWRLEPAPEDYLNQ